MRFCGAIGLFLVSFSFILSGCSAVRGPRRPSYDAVHTVLAPEIDGRLEESVWKQAPAYTLAYSTDREGVPSESATIKLAWNEQGLYLAAQLQDSDILAESNEDEVRHYKLGDVLELFVKPRDDSYYWEMYVTPRGRKSTLFFFKSAQGRRFTDPLAGHAFRELKVGAVVEGTLNAPDQPDKGWTAEMWVPISYLEHFEEPWGPEGKWTLFCGRYNYGKDFEAPDLSMTPPVSRTSYHLTDEYAELRFLKILHHELTRAPASRNTGRTRIRHETD